MTTGRAGVQKLGPRSRLYRVQQQEVILGSAGTVLPVLLREGCLRPGKAAAMRTVTVRTLGHGQGQGHRKQQEEEAGIGRGGKACPCGHQPALGTECCLDGNPEGKVMIGPGHPRRLQWATPGKMTRSRSVRVKEEGTGILGLQAQVRTCIALLSHLAPGHPALQLQNHTEALGRLGAQAEPG